MTNERLRHVLETLVREAQAVADDHHQPRYARLDEALELAREVLGSPVEPSANQVECTCWTPAQLEASAHSSRCPVYRAAKSRAPEPAPVNQGRWGTSELEFLRRAIASNPQKDPEGLIASLADEIEWYVKQLRGGESLDQHAVGLKEPSACMDLRCICPASEPAHLPGCPINALSRSPLTNEEQS